ncbi:MAG: DUF370 domain-containing protein [Vallitaleaceae bacterium]|nr:DUF370 domain-containing protein [Vallitaleaceae bacterium]
MNKQFINIGFGSVVMTDKILSIMNPESAPIKRMIQGARELGQLIDATCGRKTRAVIFMTNGHIVLSGIQVETIVSRLENNEDKK